LNWTRSGSCAYCFALAIFPIMLDCMGIPHFRYPRMCGFSRAISCVYAPSARTGHVTLNRLELRLAWPAKMNLLRPMPYCLLAGISLHIVPVRSGSGWPTRIKGSISI
jgi:hypothetical protein